MDRMELAEKHNISLYLQGRRLSVKSASVGSIVFAFIYLVTLYVNTYLIERIETPWDLESFFFQIFFTVFGTVIVFLVALALSYFPALFLGGLLANVLEKDASKHTLSKRSAIAKGALLGAVGGCMICLPILLLEFLFTLLTRHGDLISPFYQSGEAIVIASFSGGWTGRQIEKLISK